MDHEKALMHLCSFLITNIILFSNIAQSTLMQKKKRKKNYKNYKKNYIVIKYTTFYNFAFNKTTTT